MLCRPPGGQDGARFHPRRLPSRARRQGSRCRPHDRASAHATGALETADGSLHAFLTDQQPLHLPKGPMGKAISYILGNWKTDTLPRRRELRQTTTAPRLRYASFALGEDFLHVGHEEAGENIAGLYSLTAPVTPMGQSARLPHRRARQDRLHPQTASTNSCRIFGGRQTSQPSRRRLPDSHRDHWLRGSTSSVGRLRAVVVVGIESSGTTKTSVPASMLVR